VSGFSQLWKKLAKSKRYRAEFVAAQVKRGIPFQVRALLKQTGLSQEKLASQAGLTQGVVSRAADPNYGNLTLNTIIRIAAGFDVAFVGKFVPFSELAKWFIDLSESSVAVKSFNEESNALDNRKPPRTEMNFVLPAAGAGQVAPNQAQAGVHRSDAWGGGMGGAAPPPVQAGLLTETQGRLVGGASL
jgi:transcriptional regulator with XRE-family HTH domain